jgi:hypothetical protein
MSKEMARGVHAASASNQTRAKPNQSCALEKIVLDHN